MKYPTKTAWMHRADAAFSIRSFAARHGRGRPQTIDNGFGQAGTPWRLARAREWVQRGLAAGMVAAALVGLSAKGLAADDATIHVTATLVSPIDVELEWKDPSPGAVFHTVEYSTNPKGPYIILHFCPPNQTTYKHPDLMPQTTFYYRVRPIYGPVSNTVEVTMPNDLPEATYVRRYSNGEDYSWAGPKTLSEGTATDKKSIRDAATSTEAGPTDFRAVRVPVTVSGFQLTWKNHSNDEEGYLLEANYEGNEDFQVAAVMLPNINAFGWALCPPQREGRFRVRAYYYGAPSNLAHATTVLPSQWKQPSAQPSH